MMQAQTPFCAKCASETPEAPELIYCNHCEQHHCLPCTPPHCYQASIKYLHGEYGQLKLEYLADIARLKARIKHLEYLLANPDQCEWKDCTEINCTASVRDKTDEWRTLCHAHAEPFSQDQPRSGTRLKPEELKE